MNDQDSLYPSLQEDVITTLSRFKPHDHLCVIYETRDEWKNVVIPFIRIGLEKGEKCLYIVDTRTADEVIQALEADGIDPQPYIKSSALTIVNSGKAYTRDGVFNPDNMIALLAAETEKARTRGFPALRATGEMDWVPKGCPGSDRILEYEAKLNRDFFSRNACLALCQYDRSKCSSEDIKAAILTHPFIIHDNRVYRNFYFIPDGEFPNETQPHLEIRHWLENIKRENINETRTKVFLESTSDMVFLKDEAFRFIIANRALLDFLGKRKDEVLGRTNREVMSREWAETFQTSDEQALRHDGLVVREETIGGGVYEVRKFPVPMSEGRTGVGGLIRDVTDRKAAEDAVRKSARKYREFFRTSRDCIFITSPDGRWLDFNDAAVELLGFPNRAALEAVSIQDTYARPEERRHLLEQLQSRDFLKDYPLDLKRGDGRIIHALITVAVIRDADGRIESLQGTIRDVTEQKQAEKRLKAALKEKDILLREIHHRVKNNLQIVSSLLNLQAGAADNPELKEMLAVCTGRLKSMALIHEKLYQSKDFSSVDFRSYIEILTAHLFSISGAERRGIRPEIEVEDIGLDITRAIPCGLIINELVSNALAHAYPAGRTGKVGVSMKKVQGGLFELRVVDDGCGIPEDVNVADPASLGLQIVRDLVQQIDGRLSHASSDEGTVFTIRF